jgi:GTPase SAR1 family protein
LFLQSTNQIQKCQVRSKFLLNTEPKLKITMLGGGGVGKSQLTLAYLKEKFQDGVLTFSF